MHVTADVDVQDHAPESFFCFASGLFGIRTRAACTRKVDSPVKTTGLYHLSKQKNVKHEKRISKEAFNDFFSIKTLVRGVEPAVDKTVKKLL